MAAIKQKSAKMVKVRIQCEARVTMDTVKELTEEQYHELKESLQDKKDAHLEGLLSVEDIDEITYDNDMVFLSIAK